MHLYLSFIDIFNIFAISVLFTFSIYHIIIYLGRRSTKYEIYNVYFAIFSICSSMYILFNSNITRFIISSNNIENFILPSLYLIFYFGIIFGITKMLIILLKIPENNYWIFKTYYFLLIISILISISNFFIGFQLYIKYIYPIIFFLFKAPLLIIIIININNWVITKKLYTNKSIKVLIFGTIIFLFYYIIERILFILNIESFFNNNFLFEGIAIFAFGYVIAERFNSEHNELINIKNNLEQIVEDRTNKLKSANEKIENIINQKTNLFINLAHETKTPLTLISNYLDEYLKKNRNTNELHIVKHNIDKLKRDMINFLDTEKLERKQTFFNHDQIINISKLLEMKVKLFLEAAKKKKINIKSDIEKNVYIKIDPFAADRIINNIIDNAIKYTMNSGIIKIFLKSNNDKIFFIVEDNGIGISKDQQENIFKSYHQISFEKRNIQGIGMGLSIVKNILDSINSTININSDLHKGSKFTITFDKYLISNNDIILEDIKVSKPFISFTNIELKKENYEKGRYNILIVEDNEQLLSYIQNKLYDTYNIFYAKNGEEALEKLENIPKPNIIISDVLMDVMDGYKFYEILKENKDFNYIPFIFLTAKTSNNEKIMGLSQGAVDYICKPFMIEELLLKIESIIKNQLLLKNNNIKNFEDKIKKIILPEPSYNKTQSIFSFQALNKYNIKPKEKLVIQELINGSNYKDISSKLSISINTLKKHIQNIYKKINVQNRVELINFIEKRT